MYTKKTDIYLTLRLNVCDLTWNDPITFLKVFLFKFFIRKYVFMIYCSHTEQSSDILNRDLLFLKSEMIFFYFRAWDVQMYQWKPCYE